MFLVRCFTDLTFKVENYLNLNANTESEQDSLVLIILNVYTLYVIPYYIHVSARTFYEKRNKIRL